jgi:flagellar motor switch protein FliN
MQEQQTVTNQNLTIGTSADTLGLGALAVLERSTLNRVLNVDLELRVEMGRVKLPIREILDLSCGSIVDLHKALDEPMEVLVGDKLLAKGEIVVVDDMLGIRVTEIVNPENAAESIGF